MRTALIQGMKNANKTGVRFGWVANGGLMEGAGSLRPALNYPCESLGSICSFLQSATMIQKFVERFGFVE